MHLIKRLLSWALTLFLCALLLNLPAAMDEGDLKLIANKLQDGVGENILFSRIAMLSGFEFFEPHIRYATGILEILAALLLLLPVTRRLGATLVLLLSLISIALHLSPWLGIDIPLDATATQTDNGSLFYQHITCFLAGLLLLWIHPKVPSHTR